MDWLIVGIILTSFVMLGASRLASCIRMVALQGALLSILPLLAKPSFWDFHGLLLFVGSFTIKALAIPFFLFRSLKEARIKQEVEPVVSLHMTLISDFPLTVEMGVLLDLLVGVFVMGIMVYHINRTFDHIDTTVLSKLRDIE